MNYCWTGRAMPGNDALVHFGPMVNAKTILEKNIFTGEYTKVEHEALHAVAQHALEFLGNGHAALGRAGPVCPYIRAAISRQYLSLAPHRGDPLDIAEIVQAFSLLRQAFLAASAEAPAEVRQLVSFVIVFPPTREPVSLTVIEGVQRALKPDFVDEGLMVGEFHPDCEAPGLRSADFRPLKSPVAAIAIRHMALQDAPFLAADPSWRDVYERRFGDEGRRCLAALPSPPPVQPDLMAP